MTTIAAAPATASAGDETAIRRVTRRTMRQDWEERTYKREIAVLGLAVWLLLTIITTIRYLILPPDAVMLAAMGAAFGPVYATATTMIFVFAGAAFSIDAYAKQIK